MKFIGAHRERWGVEPICRALHVAPSTYYAAVSRQPSVRSQRDEQLKREITRVHRDNFGVYGIEKVWRQLNREGIQVGRDRVHRLMDEMDLEGVVRGKRKPITTMPTEVDTRPADLVERNFAAAAPNGLWVADLTYVSTWNGYAVTMPAAQCTRCLELEEEIAELQQRLAARGDHVTFSPGPNTNLDLDRELKSWLTAQLPEG